MRSLVLLASLLCFSHTGFALNLSTGAGAIVSLADDKASPAEEADRLDHLHNAATYEEFLNWATPEEIADDLGITDQERQQMQFENVSLRPGAVHIDVYLGAQSIHIVSPEGTVDGGALGGREHHRTPLGCSGVYRTARVHHSTLYHGASMPNSVFFGPTVALHAGSLSTLSHGCVHLDWETSDTVFRLATTYSGTRICIHP